MKLIQGQTNVRIEIEVDMMDGGQQLQSILDTANSIKIDYLFKNFEGDDEEGEWVADGYFMDGLKPVVYYIFKQQDSVPDDCQYLVGRLIIEDSTGSTLKGRVWSIGVSPDELI